MEKVSVIIPTIQKNVEVLQHLINILNADDAVSEIILINNAVKPFEKTIIGDKVMIYTPTKNLYVNKSWNYGVSKAKNDIFLIINDDIICTKNFCTKLLSTEIFDIYDTGLVGIDVDYIHKYTSEEVNDSFFEVEDTPANKIFFNKLDEYLFVGNWGSAFFGRKKCYYNIPGIFNIIYGDNYLLKQNMQNDRVNYAVSGLHFNHIHSLSSSSSEFSVIVDDDLNAAEDFFGIKRNFEITIDLNNLR